MLIISPVYPHPKLEVWVNQALNQVFRSIINILLRIVSMKQMVLPILDTFLCLKLGIQGEIFTEDLNTTFI